MARPRKQVSESQVEKLAEIFCTNDEIAAVCGCSVDTIERRFAGTIKQGRERGRESLKRQQYKQAMKGNTTMLIWLGKQHLGQADKAQTELTGSIQHSHGVSDAMKGMLSNPESLAAARVLRSHSALPAHNGNGHANGNGCN